MLPAGDVIDRGRIVLALRREDGPVRQQALEPLDPSGSCQPLIATSRLMRPFLRCGRAITDRGLGAVAAMRQAGAHGPRRRQPPAPATAHGPWRAAAPGRSPPRQPAIPLGRRRDRSGPAPAFARHRAPRRRGRARACRPQPRSPVGFRPLTVTMTGAAAKCFSGRSTRSEGPPSAETIRWKISAAFPPVIAASTLRRASSRSCAAARAAASRRQRHRHLMHPHLAASAREIIDRIGHLDRIGRRRSPAANPSRSAAPWSAARAGRDIGEGSSPGLPPPRTYP